MSPIVYAGTRSKMKVAVTFDVFFITKACLGKNSRMVLPRVTKIVCGKLLDQEGFLLFLRSPGNKYNQSNTLYHIPIKYEGCLGKSSSKETNTVKFTQIWFVLCTFFLSIHQIKTKKKHQIFLEFFSKPTNQPVTGARKENFHKVKVIHPNVK